MLHTVPLFHVGFCAAWIGAKLLYVRGLLDINNIKRAGAEPRMSALQGNSGVNHLSQMQHF